MLNIPVSRAAGLSRSLLVQRLRQPRDRYDMKATLCRAVTARQPPNQMHECIVSERSEKMLSGCEMMGTLAGGWLSVLPS